MSCAIRTASFAGGVAGFDAEAVGGLEVNEFAALRAGSQSVLVRHMAAALLGHRRAGALHPDRFDRIVVANGFLPTGDAPPGDAFLRWREYSQTTPEFHVGGIIKAFNAINAGGMGDPRMLSGGIAQALVTTAAGLCVAIPSLIAYRYLRGRVDRIVIEIEKDAIQLADALETPQAAAQADAP